MYILNNEQDNLFGTHDIKSAENFCFFYIKQIICQENFPFRILVAIFVLYLQHIECIISENSMQTAKLPISYCAFSEKIW